MIMKRRIKMGIIILIDTDFGFFLFLLVQLRSGRNKGSFSSEPHKWDSNEWLWGCETVYSAPVLMLVCAVCFKEEEDLYGQVEDHE